MLTQPPRFESPFAGPPGNALGSGCNDPLLASTFALANAPAFTVTRDQQARINRVLDELRHGHGGTLVCAPHDETLDSPAFLANGLRVFSGPQDGIHPYKYRFDIICGRLSRYPDALADARLDWDIWRSFLMYENFTGGIGKFPEHEHTYSEGSAADLVWEYLRVNHAAISGDRRRCAWWIKWLTHDLESPGGRPLRRWLLLNLVSGTDKQTAKVAAKYPPQEKFWTLSPSQDRPFLTVDYRWRVENAHPRVGPPFREAIAEIAASQGLAYEVWGISDEFLPATSIWNVDLSTHMGSVSLASVIDQESWSNERRDFFVTFWRPIGSRLRFFHIRLPSCDSADGVFFFTYNARLYVWPKARMDDAVIQMLHVSALIDRHSLGAYRRQGFAALTTTASGPAPGG